MTAHASETANFSLENDRIKKLKTFIAKHKIPIALGAALAVSVTINVIRPASLPKISDATWYALTPEDVAFLNELLENHHDFAKF